MAVFTGSGNAEVIYGGVDDDSIVGLGGNDTLDGSYGGIDTIYGGTGSDLIYARSGDLAFGDDDGDLIVVAGDLPATLDGGLGNDTLRFDNWYDISGSNVTGIETLFANSNGYLTTTQLAAFSLVSGYSPGSTSAGLTLTKGGTATVNLSLTLTNSFSLQGSGGAEKITFNAAHPYTIYAYMGGGNDKVATGSGNDSIRGEAGNDSLSGLIGNDSLDGGDGRDTVLGGDGNDVIYVGRGDSTYGGAGDDLFLITGSTELGLVSGGADVDSLRFESGYDISGLTLTGIETALLYGNDLMTATQMGQFNLLTGYNGGTNAATISLTQGGTATATLGATLTNYFQLNGSAEADLITFNSNHLYLISAYMGGGDDFVSSGAGNDSLRGDAGNDTLLGLAGSDSLDGGLGQDSLEGGVGTDYLVAGARDTVLGGADNDMISVQDNFPAVLNGGTGTDILRFESGYDISGATLSGFETLYANGNDSMTAAQFDSFDTVMGYNSGTTSATVTLTQGGTAAIAVANTLTSYFQLYGSAQADLITFAPGSLGTIYAYMGDGNDSVTASDGNDSLRGDNGNDTLYGMAANDTLDGGNGADLLDGGTGADWLAARLGDTLSAGDGDDFVTLVENLPASIDGGIGNDTLRFEAGYDTTGATITGVENLFLAGAAVLTATQLGGFSTVAGYSPGTTSVYAYLSEGGTASINLAVTLTSTFTLYGSSQADLLTFNAGHNGFIAVNAGYGDDMISAGANNDTLNGDVGNDTLLGQGGNDVLDGGQGNDSLDGSAGNDYLVARRFDTVLGGADDDLIQVVESLPASLDGGAGTDTLRFASTYDITGTVITGFEVLAIYNTPVMTAAQLAKFTTVTGYEPGYTSASVALSVGGSASVKLSPTLTAGFTLYGSGDADKITFNASYLGAVSTFGGFGADSFTGASGGDVLRGESGNDTLNGADGADRLEGGNGADQLIGGEGVDTLIGGSGRDIFIFANLQSSPGGTPDIISDFEAAGANQGDRINVSAIDADGVLGVNDAFVFGSAGLGGLSLVDSGDDTLVRLNVDNDADFEVIIRITDGGTITAANYIAADFTL